MRNKTIVINGQVTELRSREHLISTLDTASSEDYLEIWMRGEGESALCIMTNTNSAFLMYLRHEVTPDSDQTIDLATKAGPRNSNYPTDKLIYIRKHG